MGIENDMIISKQIALITGATEHFLQNEYTIVINGLEKLIKRLHDTAKTLNPQDASRVQIEQAAEQIQSLLDIVKSQEKIISQVEV
jgi:hypothetical protein